MVLWKLITNLKDYVANKPPGVTFFLCLLTLAISFMFLSFYSYGHILPNPDMVKDWNHLLSSIAQYHLCEENRDDTFNATIDFAAKESYACLTIKAPSHQLSIMSPLPPACPQNVINKQVPVIYTEAKKMMTVEEKCYSLEAIYDPTLQVMLTKEDQLVAVWHLLEVALLLLGVCLIFCLSVSLTHSPNPNSPRKEQLLHLEPLVYN
ncbi:hypothetical protein WMY93_004974 [Mugilogobius chulae]|uniref:TMEM248/TMEM219 domain-containing protein n=1 Tax=Mugilogobius chulae TaxID=88201 RepID=A0AAW0Q172_9GOBI